MGGVILIKLLNTSLKLMQVQQVLILGLKRVAIVNNFNVHVRFEIPISQPKNHSPLGVLFVN